MSNNQIRAAIVGLGGWGQLLVKSADDSETVKFTAAVTRTPSKVVEFCTERDMTLSDTLDDVLGNPDIDAVVIATPHTQHFDQLMAAAKAGKHVYCEKPWTLDAGEGRTALKAFADAGLKVAIGHNRRFCPNTQAMTDILNAGKLGTPLHIDGHMDSNLSPNVGKWRDNRAESPAGGMTSMGIHVIDMFVHFFGEVADVNTQSKTIASPIDADDSTIVRMNFKSGCTGHLTTISTTAMLWRIGVFCQGGWVEMRHHNTLEVFSLADGQSTEVFPGYEFPGVASIKGALEAFAADINGGPAYPCTPDQIVHATAVLAAIIESAQTGKTVSL
ncbi:MAG: Gfo/Idh/MocA family oxidoreductase [Rhodospirillaceae bacterium]